MSGNARENDVLVEGQQKQIKKIETNGMFKLTATHVVTRRQVGKDKKLILILRTSSSNSLLGSTDYTALI